MGIHLLSVWVKESRRV